MAMTSAMGDLSWGHPAAGYENPTEFLARIAESHRVARVRPYGPPPASQRHELRAVTRPEFTVSYRRTGLGHWFDEPGSDYFLNIGMSGPLTVARGTNRLVSTRELGAIVNPGDDQLLVTDPQGAEILTVRIGAGIMQRELTALLGHAPSRPTRFDLALDMSGQAQGAIAVLDGLLAQIDSGHDLLQHPALQLAMIRSLATCLLLTAGHSHSADLRAGAGRPRSRPLRLALDYMSANLDKPLTLGDIAAAAGYSARTLNASFAEHLGTSPMNHLRQLRLDRVRADLLTGNGSITEIALRWGFTHLSRFARCYHARFGELPSQTARAAA